MENYKEVLRKYAVFSGRARRKEYWMFALFNMIASIVLSIVDGFINIKVINLGILGLIYMLAILIPSIAVGVRRLHDTNRSGWWLLLSLIPIIGWIILFVFTVIDSTPGDNKYGSNPKGISPA